MHRRTPRSLALLAVTLTALATSVLFPLSAAPPAAATSASTASAATPGSTASADWLRTERFGVMLHYLAEGCAAGQSCSSTTNPSGHPYPTTEQWNARVNSFDVTGLARQIKSTGAGYLILSVGQISGFFAAPNAVYEELVPATTSHPSRLSRRDLIAELGEALDAEGLRLIVYVPNDPMRYDPYAVERLGGTSTQGGVNSATWQDNWLRVLGSWADTWGTSVDGWWVDGSQASASYSERIVNRLHEGNADAIVAVNWTANSPGSLSALRTNIDYFPGETIQYQQYPRTTANSTNTTRFVPGVTYPLQTHFLSRATGAWGAEPGTPFLYTDQQIQTYTTTVTNYGGARTWDVPYNRTTGLLDTATIDMLKGIGRATGMLSDPNSIRTDDRSTSVSYTGNWRSGTSSTFHNSTVRWSTAAGQTASFTFTGTGVRWIGALGPAEGMADVRIDGQLQSTVDLNVSIREPRSPVFSAVGLSSGQHTISITTRNSGGVAVDAFEVTP